MKALLLLAVAMPMVSFAQMHGREQKERALVSAMNESRRAILSNLQRMSDQDLMRAEKLLEKVTEVALGTGPGPGPFPPVRFVCAQEMNINLTQQTFIKLKDFAYSGTGLNYGSQQATSYAQNWMENHPCHRADSFIADVKRLKNFAYSGSGLNYGSQTSIDFALTRVDRFCSQFEIENTFKQHYNFAYSGTGLNYGSQQARDYAFAKVEPLAFNCMNE